MDKEMVSLIDRRSVFADGEEIAEALIDLYHNSEEEISTFHRYLLAEAAMHIKGLQDEHEKCLEIFSKLNGGYSGGY
mgnify:CR=1 FL=1